MRKYKKSANQKGFIAIENGKIVAYTTAHLFRIVDVNYNADTDELSTSLYTDMYMEDSKDILDKCIYILRKLGKEMGYLYLNCADKDNVDNYYYITISAV